MAVTTTSRFRRTAEYVMGDTAQRTWARICVSRGGVALPVYDFAETAPEDKAPTVMMMDGTTIAPDVLYINPTTGTKWHDVKAKTAPTFRRLPPGPRMEHGCDWSAACEYQRVQTASGIPVYIIIHETSGAWLSIRLDTAFEIGDHRTDWPGGKAQPWRRGRRGQGGLLWARDRMTVCEVTA